MATQACQHLVVGARDAEQHGAKDRELRVGVVGRRRACTAIN